MSAIDRIRLPQPVIWTPLLGLVRSLVALGGLITVAFTREDFLFRPVSGVGTYPLCTHVDQAGLFCLVRDDLAFGRIICIAVLILVISGFLPQVTSVLHAWVAFSIASSISIPERGDQIAAILALLLVPICLGDPRVNHWMPGRRGTRLIGVRTGAAVVFLVAAKVQVAVLYFYSGAGKLFQTEWAEGTALYYIGQGFFGSSGLFLQLIVFVTSIPLALFVLTWGTMALEIALAALPLLRGRLRVAVALLGAALHLGIIVFIGLWSFQITMFGALILLAVPLVARPYSEGATFGSLLPARAKRMRSHTQPHGESSRSAPVTHAPSPSDTGRQSAASAPSASATDSLAIPPSGDSIHRSAGAAEAVSGPPPR